MYKHLHVIPTKYGKISVTISSECDSHVYLVELYHNVSSLDAIFKKLCSLGWALGIMAGCCDIFCYDGLAVVVGVTNCNMSEGVAM